MTTFSDNYGDSLVLTFSPKTVDFEAVESGHISALEFSNEEVERIAHALLEGIGEAGRPPLQTDPTTLFSGESGSERFEWNRAAAIAASKLGLGIEFKYTKSESAPVEPRTLTRVNDVIETKDGNWVVLGHSDERDDERSFRLDRIVSFVKVNG